MKIYLEGIPEKSQHDVEWLEHLLGLPGKILTHHEVDGLAHIVLHDLAHSNSFGLDRAGYFVDNPDFNCLRGIAGYCSDECCNHKSDMWTSPHEFMNDMQKAAFHQKLSTYLDRSIVRSDSTEVDKDALRVLGEQLGIQNPLGMQWKMKHGNTGILVFNGDGERYARYQELFREIIPLLSLCS